MALDLRKFLSRFCGEARDHLQRLEGGLSGLATGRPLAPDAINELFRAAHTIKGSARMLKLDSIAETAHQLEEVLGALRDGALEQPPELGQLLLRAVDAISVLVEQVESSGGQLPPSDQALCTALARAATGALTTAGDAAAVPASGADPAAHAEPPSASTPASTPASGQAPSRMPPAAGATEQEPAPASARPSASATPSLSPSATPSAPVESGAMRPPESVRVRMDKLDELIKLMGEVVSSQTQFRQRMLEARALDAAFQSLLDEAGPDPGPAQGPDQEHFAELAERLHRFTLSLRDLAMEQELLSRDLNDRALIMRMLPLSILFDPIARVARQLGQELGKDVHCEISGGDIELDRHLIDRLGDALVHLLRNAIDHGLEPPAQRAAAGKDRLGRVRLSARQEGVGVLIELSDDGRGLDHDRILARAVQKGLVEAARAPTLAEDQIAELIFHPGFSTSPIITEISGRGVGLDVVKRTILGDLQGALEIFSQPGQGTRIRLQLPLSLAVMRVLLFEAAGQVFGLTAAHIAELIRVRESETLIVAGRPAILLHDHFLPLVPVAELLGLDGPPVTPSHAGGERLVLVIQGHPSRLGLFVDRLIDERDMVIKPLPEHMQALGLVAGIVITGTNALVSVLQAPALLEAARRARSPGLMASAAPVAMATPPRQAHILVVDDSRNTREIEKEILEAHGYQVTLAEDGIDGWQKAIGGQFDAVLTDVDMPTLDGFGLTARLREHERYRATPIVIVTSRQKEADKQRGIQAGADAYIVKGDFNQSSLVETLQNLLP